MAHRLKDRRVLVVGASRGIGLAIGRACAEEGASVALAARTVEKLEAAAAEIDGNVIAVQCDVRDEPACRAAVEGAAASLGGIDALIYAAGISAFSDVADLRMPKWELVFGTNVFGAATATSAALPFLEESLGHAVYLGSESGIFEPHPWRGISAYIASKRALDSIVRSYQLEHPAVSFTNYIVGATITEFGSDADDEGAFAYAGEWIDKGYISIEHVLDPADHGHAVVELLTLPPGVTVDRFGLTGRRSPKSAG